MNQHQREGIVLAIATSQRLANLPWEVLHDGNQFLVQRIPAIVPVRWLGNGKPLIVRNEQANRALNVLFMATALRDVQPELDYEAEEGRILEATKRSPLNLVVEESCCLEELGELLEDQERVYFELNPVTSLNMIFDQDHFSSNQFLIPGNSSADLSGISQKNQGKIQKNQGKISDRSSLIRIEI
ncbi:MAG: hypothetical protein HC835_18875 [Oscillatoriales cyanobacterium RM2_1_1]|nr:hypothetical protein [Oscillatoriales cyanobacterium SM2_3_0]NJO47500.1 hypothetical protein [Oscillatoriales cyanobacterium RM2_1_1]